MAKMQVFIGEGKKVKAEYKGFTIETDQPEKYGGENSAPAPFDLFLASLGTCVGFFMGAFCRRMNLPTFGFKIEMEFIGDPQTHLVKKILTKVTFPENFPEKYKNAVFKSADSCSVTKQMKYMPEFEIIEVNGVR